MLVAPVGPARFRWYPDAGTAGRAAAFSFKHQDRIYTLFYAHCEEPLWESGTGINMGISRREVAAAAIQSLAAQLWMKVAALTTST